VYYFNDGEQMVIETDLPYNSGSFFVKNTLLMMLLIREHWLQWTDATKIENTSYVKQSLIFIADCLMKHMKNRYCC
jgi:hypothetical protein